MCHVSKVSKEVSESRRFLSVVKVESPENYGGNKVGEVNFDLISEF